MSKPNLLSLTKNGRGKTVTTLAESFGPLPPDDGPTIPPSIHVAMAPDQVLMPEDRSSPCH